MHDESNKHRRAPAVLVLPEKSHFELVELRDHVRLMGRLAEPGPASIDDDKRLRPHLRMGVQAHWPRHRAGDQVDVLVR